jgi:hypothetical protein
MISQTFLIDLDACMDTRLGALSQISLEGVTAIMRNKYWSRDTDDFELMSGGLITNAQFAAQYAIRDKETLKASMMTQLFSVLGPMTKELQYRQSQKVEIGTINVIINFWPYALDDDEKKMLMDAMSIYLAINVRISSAYIPPDHLTPKELDGLADIAIMYGYNDWLTLHLEELVKSRIPMMTIMGPQILYNKQILTEELLNDPETGERRDPFKVHSLIMAEFLAVEFQSSSVFSSIC